MQKVLCGNGKLFQCIVITENLDRDGGWWVGGGERLGKVIWGGQRAQPPTPYMGQGGGRAVTFVVIPSQAIEDNKAGIIGKIW